MCLCPLEVRAKILECLLEPIYYDEIAMSFARMQTECRDFMASFKQEGVPLEEVLPGFVQFLLSCFKKVLLTTPKRSKMWASCPDAHTEATTLAHPVFPGTDHFRCAF